MTITSMGQDGYGALLDTQILPTQHIAGLSFSATTPRDAARFVLGAAKARSAVHVHLANAYTVSLSDRDEKYLEVLTSGVVFPDGKPIAWFSRLYRQHPALEQVRGPQLFLDVLKFGREYSARHFFLGSTPKTIELMRTRLVRNYPGLEIVGGYSPPFRSMTDAEVSQQDALILSHEPDIVWVGLGTPKQDYEAQRIATELGITAVAVGAAFDFSAGTLKVAPKWMQNIGIEWLFRLLAEPRRLWRRYLFGNARFIVAASTRSRRRY